MGSSLNRDPTGAEGHIRRRAKDYGRFGFKIP